MFTTVKTNCFINYKKNSLSNAVKSELKVYFIIRSTFNTIKKKCCNNSKD